MQFSVCSLKSTGQAPPCSVQSYCRLSKKQVYENQRNSQESFVHPQSEQTSSALNLRLNHFSSNNFIETYRLNSGSFDGNFIFHLIMDKMWCTIFSSEMSCFGQKVSPTNQIIPELDQDGD